MNWHGFLFPFHLIYETQFSNGSTDVSPKVSVPNIFNQMCVNPSQVSNPATSVKKCGRETCKAVVIKWRFHVVPFNSNSLYSKGLESNEILDTCNSFACRISNLSTRHQAWLCQLHTFLKLTTYVFMYLVSQSRHIYRAWRDLQFAKNKLLAVSALPNLS